MRFQDILRNRTPIDPADRALGPAIQRYVTGDFQLSVLPQLRGTDPAAQATGFARTAAFYTEMAPFQRAQLKFDAIPAIEPSDTTPNTAPAAPSRTAFSLEKVLPKPVAHAMAGALDALGATDKAKQLSALYKAIGSENWSNFCAELRSTGRFSDATVTLAYAATQPDAEHMLPDLATVMNLAMQPAPAAANAPIDPATVKAAKDQVQQKILSVADKIGLKDVAGSLVHIGGCLAEMLVRNGDSPETAGARATVLIGGHVSEQESEIPLGGGGEPPSPEDRGDDGKISPAGATDIVGNAPPDQPAAAAAKPQTPHQPPAKNKSEERERLRTRLTDHYGKKRADKMIDFIDYATRLAAEKQNAPAAERDKLWVDLNAEIATRFGTQRGLQRRLDLEGLQAGLQALSKKAADPNWSEASEDAYTTFREGFFPGKAVAPHERLYDTVQNWKPPEDKTPRMDGGLEDIDYRSISSPPSPKDAARDLIKEMRLVYKMTDDQLADYIARAKNVIRPEHFAKFQSAINEIRKGRLYTKFDDELRAEYAPDSNWEEFVDIAADAIPGVSHVKSFVEIIDSAQRTFDAFKHPLDKAETQSERDRLATALAIDVLTAFFPNRLVGRGARAIANSPIVQELKERLLAQFRKLKGTGEPFDLTEFAMAMAGPGEKNWIKQVEKDAAKTPPNAPNPHAPEPSQRPGSLPDPEKPPTNKPDPSVRVKTPYDYLERSPLHDQYGDHWPLEYARLRGQPIDKVMKEVELLNEAALGRLKPRKGFTKDRELMTKEEFDHIDHEGKIHPKHLHPTQATFKEKFRSGDEIDGMVVDLIKGGKKFPPIRIFERDGVVYTLDHRRYIAGLRANKEIDYVKVDFNDLSKDLQNRVRQRSFLRGPYMINEDARVLE